MKKIISINYRFRDIRSWKALFQALGCLFVTYVLLSFLSFNPDDNSRFSVTYPQGGIENWGGQFGAWLVSILVYYFGINSLFWIIGLLPLIFKYSRKFGIAFISIVPLSFTILGGLFHWSLVYRDYPIWFSGTLSVDAIDVLVSSVGRAGVFVVLLATLGLPIIFFNLDQITRYIGSLSRKIPRVRLKEKKNDTSTNLNTVQEEDATSRWKGPIQYLNRTTSETVSNRAELDATGKQIVEILGNFQIQGEVVGYEYGPVVATYHFRPAPGVRQAKIQTVSDDLALGLQVESVFISALAEKQSIGIQIPHKQREMVFLGDLVEDLDTADSPLQFCLGREASGRSISVDLAEMPHLLIAGATGSGKSVGINTLLVSILMNASPEDVRLILIDPKQLELAVYEGIPHLMLPVITEPKKATIALRWVVKEMERRYSVLHAAGVRNIDSYRAKSRDPMSYIVVVIDELADLMLTASADIELLIQRLAQKARACGIHMVLATQRPSVDVITGVIKANLPSRISYQVFSRHDSRTILDQIGAENLLGKGDLLFVRPGKKHPMRVQSAFVSDEEVFKVVEELKGSANLDEDATQWIENYSEEGKSTKSSTLEPVVAGS